MGFPPHDYLLIFRRHSRYSDDFVWRVIHVYVICVVKV